MKEQDQIYANRVAYLRALIEEHGGNRQGGATRLAIRLGFTTASRIVQLAGPNPRHRISEKWARAAEEKLDLPPGVFDIPLGEQPAVKLPPRNEKLLQRTFNEVMSLKKKGVLSDEEFTNIVIKLYKEKL